MKSKELLEYAQTLIQHEMTLEEKIGLLNHYMNGKLIAINADDEAVKKLCRHYITYIMIDLNFYNPTRFAESSKILKMAELKFSMKLTQKQELLLKCKYLDDVLLNNDIVKIGNNISIAIEQVLKEVGGIYARR